MNKALIAFALCSMVFSSYGAATESKPTQEYTETHSIVGDWSGVIDLKVMKVTLVLHVQQDPKGALSATLDAVEQGADGMEIDAVSFDGKTLKFEIKEWSVKFEGLLGGDTGEIAGQWTQFGKPFPLTFASGTQALLPLNRPQEPQAPLPYTEEQVSYENSEAGVSLSGTLTLPDRAGPFPAVVLIAGAGPHDRDEAVVTHKPFLVLADYLTRQGVAVLRFDKRGCGESTGDYEQATTQDFADDALAGVAYLKSRKEIVPHQIGLIGHSEGGTIAPMVAAKSEEVAFIVLMAGTGVNGEEVLYEQNVLIQRAGGETEETIEQSQKFLKQIITLVKKEPDTEIAATQLLELAQKHLAQLPQTQTDVTLEMLEVQTKFFNANWARYFFQLEPATALKEVQVPVLALNGELDLQVPPYQNLPAIAQALKEAGNADYTIVELPKLNHLFQTCATGSTVEYAQIEETIAPSVLELISEWILERTSEQSK